jgi:hypothetical protein
MTGGSFPLAFHDTMIKLQCVGFEFGKSRASVIRSLSLSFKPK